MARPQKISPRQSVKEKERLERLEKLAPPETEKWI
jgi:hypothetical protein